MRSASAELPEVAGALPAAVPVARPWALPAGAAVASALVFALVSSHLIDDTYITLSYAKNLAFHAHWGLIEQGTANTATSPLNVLVARRGHVRRPRRRAGRRDRVRRHAGAARPGPAPAGRAHRAAVRIRAADVRVAAGQPAAAVVGRAGGRARRHRRRLDAGLRGRAQGGPARRRDRAARARPDRPAAHRGGACSWPAASSGPASGGPRSPPSR